jgi:hypothetical protein
MGANNMLGPFLAVCIGMLSASVAGVLVIRLIPRKCAHLEAIVIEEYSRETAALPAETPLYIAEIVDAKWACTGCGTVLIGTARVERRLSWRELRAMVE